MPKDKAQELVNKIYNQLSSWDNPSLENAKQGALIAIDEIVDELTSRGILSGFWYEVKQEIEKL